MERRQKRASAPDGEGPKNPRRRKLLKIAGVGVVAVGVWRLRWNPNRKHFHHLRKLSTTAGAILYAVVDAMLPPSAPRSPRILRRYVKSIDDFLVGMPRSDILQLHLLLYGVEQATLPRGLRRFTSLDRATRQRILYDWQTSFIGLRKLGLQSLKALVFVAYYSEKSAFARIGYSGPILSPQYQGPSSQKRYDALLAPKGKEPGFS